MQQDSYTAVIRDQTARALWEVRNVVTCVPDALWDREYCQMPCWKHIYHMLHSLDLWFINPRDRDFREPPFHVQNLNNLDVPSDGHLSRAQLEQYLNTIEDKLYAYLDGLSDDRLLESPENCEYTRFTLIMAQFRHLHSHMGMLMGFVIAETGLWPRVLGLEKPIPNGGYGEYF